jgi:hypothetical protein
MIKKLLTRYLKYSKRKCIPKNKERKLRNNYIRSELKTDLYTAFYNAFSEIKFNNSLSYITFCFEDKELSREDKDMMKIGFYLLEKRLKQSGKELSQEDKDIIKSAHYLMEKRLKQKMIFSKAIIGGI